MLSKVTHFPRKLAILLIKVYQKTLSFDHSFWGKIIKPHGQCRFYPTCSSYALNSIDKYGIFKGIYLSLRRIVRCHPLSKGGYDPLK